MIPLLKKTVFRAGYQTARLGFHLVRVVAQGGLLAYHRLRHRWIDGPRLARTPPRVHAGMPLGTGRWCLAAIYQPRPPVSPNLLAYLSAWRQAGYDIVAVNDGPLPPETVAALRPLCHTVIERARGGIDVASYQAATRHLARIAAGTAIDQVVYCNDSVFVRPSALPGLIARLGAATAPVAGIFENRDPRPHIQSWLFAVAGTVFTDPAFQNFWNSYVPLSYRPAIIRTGEIGLSDCLRAHFGPPEVLWPAERAVAAALARPEVAAQPDRYAGKVLQGRYLRKALSRLAPPVAGGIEDLSALPSDRLAETLTAAAGCFNPGAVFTLMLLATEPGDGPGVDGFPFLKKDLVFKTIFPLARVERLLDGWRDQDKKEVAEILAYYRRRGTMADNPLTHVLVLSGLA